MSAQSTATRHSKTATPTHHIAEFTAVEKGTGGRGRRTESIHGIPVQEVAGTPRPGISPECVDETVSRREPRKTELERNLCLTAYNELMRTRYKVRRDYERAKEFKAKSKKDPSDAALSAAASVKLYDYFTAAVKRLESVEQTVARDKKKASEKWLESERELLHSKLMCDCA